MSGKMACGDNDCRAAAGVREHSPRPLAESRRDSTMSDGTSCHYPTLPEWVNITAVSDRTNQLMRQNWDLINQAADLLNAGDMSPLAWEKLQDLWAETVDLEVKYEATRTAEHDANHRDCGQK